MKRRTVLCRVNAQRTTQRMVRIALRTTGSDRSWAAIDELRRRGSPAMLALAQALAGSTSWRRRALGLNVAAQMKGRHRDGSWVDFALEPTQQLLLAGLHDSRVDVLRAAIAGLGHRPHAAALAGLVELAAHPDADVRFNLACALGAYEAPSAVGALLTLACDPDADVRNWATFGLGSLHSADTPDIRQCLWENLQDANLDVRCEAILGLARRHDPRAIDYLLDRLASGDDLYSLEFDAARELASNFLTPGLRQQAAALGSDVNRGWLEALQAARRACGTAANTTPS